MTEMTYLCQQCSNCKLVCQPWVFECMNLQWLDHSLHRKSAWPVVDVVNYERGLEAETQRTNWTVMDDFPTPPPPQMATVCSSPSFFCLVSCCFILFSLVFCLLNWQVMSTVLNYNETKKFAWKGLSSQKSQTIEATRVISISPRKVARLNHYSYLFGTTRKGINTIVLKTMNHA